MHSRNLSEILIYRLRELELIVRNLDADNNPSKIDIDIALDKTRKLYDILLKIRYEAATGKQGQQPNPVKPVLPSDPETFQDESDPGAEGIVPDPVHMQKEPQRPVAETNKKQAKNSGHAGQNSESSKVSATEQESQPTEDLSHDRPAAGDNGNTGRPGSNEGDIPDEPVKNGRHDIEIVADRYQSSQDYINQAMARKKGKGDLSTKMQSKPITDLRNSIGLNDKFLFIKELFKGRLEQYNQCLDTLNEAVSFEEALYYIRENYPWNEEDEVVSKFINLIKRKHQA
jgi:hypothetical protein